jgi:hypothetical protein
MFPRIPYPATRRGGAALRLIPLLLALAGCEAMREMDYLDRVFEPERFQTAQRLPPPVPVAPSPSPAPPVAMPLPDAPIEPTRPTGALADPLAAPAPDPLASPLSAPSIEAEPDTIRTVEAPPQRARQATRQQPWMTRFWAQLTPSQRARVETRLRRQNGTPPAEAPVVWDSMGLADRVRLAADDAPGFDRNSETGGN